LRFNQLAMRLDLPLFWASDDDSDGAPDPTEIRSLLFYPTRGQWVDEHGAFTPEYEAAIERIRQEANAPPPSEARAALVLAELDHAAPTLVENDLTQMPAPHREFATHMLRVGELIDSLYSHQTGMDALRPRMVDADMASRSLFRRNWGSRCRGSLTEANENCSALSGAARQPVDVYPASMQAEDTFCQTLEARADAATLLSPFTVVRERTTGQAELVAVPYPEAYPEMRAIATELRAAADAIQTDTEETALVAYLRAAAGSFESNDWGPADEAWASMNARNSRWYVRVAPDETYWDPCSHKAGFHLTFARINRDSLAWQDRLTPLQGDMERALAALVPDVYQAREVSFHMPDFIDIVINSGDDRDPFGATIGQSLPNWGRVADEGRGRTVAMSNLYTDADSQRSRRAQASSLLSSEAMALYSDDDESGLLSTILHEATHNLGPAHEYRVGGRTDDEVFGGGLASMLEELKAQSGALYFVDMLRQRGVLDDARARRVYVDSIVWAFGHISRGMYTPSGQRKAYSQLAAVQVGFLMDEGVLRWNPEARAADGEHQGAFTIDFDRFAAVAGQLMQTVMRIKSSGDREAAEALATRYVDGPTVPQPIIAMRYRHFPQVTFVFSLQN
jgi:hypothetical protein